MAQTHLPSHMTHHSDTLISHQLKDDELTLKTRNGQEVQLNAALLDQWFASIEKYEQAHNKNRVAPANQQETSALMATQLLGRYGLKSAKDVILFLKSPAGESVQEIIGERLAELAALEKETRQRYLDKQTRQHRLVAFLLLALLYRRSAHAKKLNEFVQQQIDKALHHHHIDNQSSPEAEQIKHEIASQAYRAYMHSSEAVQAELAEKLQQAQILEEHIASLQKQQDDLESKYQLFNDHLEQLDDFMAEQEAIINPDDKKELVKNKLAEINSHMEKQAEEIATLITDGKEEEASSLLQKHNALHIQAAGLNDMLLVLNGKKTLLNAEGQAVNNFKEAEFILSSQQKIIKDNGNYYLLHADQDFAAMDVHDKANAQQHYEQSKPEIGSLKKLVFNNKGIETTVHTERKDLLAKQSEHMQETILLLANNLSKIQAAQSNVSTLINPTALPKPTPTPSTTKTQAVSASQSYKQVLELIRTNPTPESLERFNRALGATKGHVEEALQKEINKIKPGAPIPPQTMLLLLATLERFAISAHKPDVTNIASPSPLRMKPGG